MAGDVPAGPDGTAWGPRGSSAGAVVAGGEDGPVGGPTDGGTVEGMGAGVVDAGDGSAAPGRAPAGDTTAADPARTVAVATARPRATRRIDRSEGTKRTEPVSLGAVTGDGQGGLRISVRPID